MNTSYDIETVSETERIASILENDKKGCYRLENELTSEKLHKEASRYDVSIGETSLPSQALEQNHPVSGLEHNYPDDDPVIVHLNPDMLDTTTEPIVMNYLQGKADSGQTVFLSYNKLFA